MKANDPVWCYPVRTPEDEQLRLIRTEGDDLLDINHRVYGGKWNCDSLNILVVDGDSGDSLIYLAEQLRNTDSTFTFLAESQLSMENIQKRAEIRKLNNIDWILEENCTQAIERLNTYDYISCQSNLSHKEDYKQIIQLLSQRLNQNGALKLSFKSFYFWQSVKTVIPVIQEVVQKYEDQMEGLKKGYEFIQNIPATNRFKTKFEYMSRLFSMQQYPDKSFYELFMHQHNNFLTVNNLFEIAEDVRLSFASFISDKPYTYNPLSLIDDNDIKNVIEHRSAQQRASIAERYYGRHIYHHAVLINGSYQNANMDGLDLAPIMIKGFSQKEKDISSAIKTGESLEINLTGSGESIIIPGETSFKFLISQFDGVTPLREIIDNGVEELHMSKESIISEVKILFDTLYPYGFVALRDPSNKLIAC